MENAEAVVISRDPRRLEHHRQAPTRRELCGRPRGRRQVTASRRRDRQVVTSDACTGAMRVWRQHGTTAFLLEDSRVAATTCFIAVDRRAAPGRGARTP